MASSSEDDPMDPAEDVEDDLFGDEDDGPTIKAQELSDRELDSGDDEDRGDRVHRAAEVDDDSGRDARIMESTIWRHPLPKPFDGEVRFIFIKLSTHTDYVLVQRPAIAKIPWH
jgi:RNA polymerase-associated protein LEO1